jgi:hypothetical protein
MNDFSEIENELRRLRPARPSPVLFKRIEEAMSENCRASVSDAGWGWKRFTRFRRAARKPGRASQTLYRFGIGLAAAAAVLLLLARIHTNQTRNEAKEIAQISPAAEPPGRSGGQHSTSPNEFVPSSATAVVYNERDEGLQFGDGLNRPLRRLRYQTHQTWQWRNPATGASLRVSYPSDEVVLIPVSGQ